LTFHVKRGSDDPPPGGSFAFPDAVQAVVPWLAQARDLGFLGPGPLEPQLAHAVGFAQAAGSVPARFVDLGTGGGLPGLVLVALWPKTAGVLLDSNLRRTEFVAEAVTALGWSARVEVRRARAEEAGRFPALRAGADLVVSRGFGPPPVVAECAAPLLAVGGLLVVSEPPEDTAQAGRWPPDPLARLGLTPDGSVEAASGRFQRLRQEILCPDAYPRRVGIPAKRPLWCVSRETSANDAGNA
jgi:16S rRNA (guanine527-N7)-methyltransferase